MSTEFDSKGRYDVHGPDGDKCGRIIKGIFKGLDGDLVGHVEGDQFICDEQLAGRVEGLTLVRTDKTRFDLVPQEQLKAEDN